jgi:cyclase
MDVKKGWLSKKQTVYVNAGSLNTKISPLEYAKKMEDAGVGEIIVNSIDADGTMNGYDLNLITSISSALKIPLVALGGAGGLEDLSKAQKAGASAVAAGSMFVFQKAHRAVLITYPSSAELKLHM